jgi:hypothetical protein
MIDLS